MGSFVAVYFSAKFEKQENVPVEVSFKKDDETSKVQGLWFPPDIPDGDEPEPVGPLEKIATALERDPVVRLVGITTPFLSIPAAIFALYKLFKRKNEKTK